MKRTLIFHIGAHRTATSALQAYLHENFGLLKKKGFLYPYRARRHQKLVNDLFSGKRSVAEVAQDLDQRAAAHNLGIHTLIVSDEDICLRRDLSLLAGFRDTFDVKIAFTLRRQDTWLESWFFQNIKWQWNEKLSHCSFDEFMAMREDFHWIHYDRYLRHIEDLFGQENVILNVLEKGQMPEGPINSVCDSMGLTDRDGFHPAAHMNESFSPVISEFMRNLPLDEAPVDYRNLLTRVCARIDTRLNGAEKKKQSERLLPHEARKALMEHYAEGNRAVAQRYFGRDALFLDPLPGAEAPLADMALPADSYELMDRFVAPLLQELISEYKKAV